MRPAVIFAVVLLVAACSAPGAEPSASPTGSSGPTPSASPGPTPSPGGSPTPSAGTAWTLSTVPTDPAGRAVSPVGSIAWGTAGGVVVGARAFEDATTPRGGAATAYASVDGATWTTAPVSADLRVGETVPTSGPEAGFAAVGAGPAGFVGIGYSYVPARASGPAGVYGFAALSVDGLRWQRTDLPDARRARPVDIAWSDDRWVVVGVDEADGAPRMAVWTSPDGRAWTRVPDLPIFGIGGYIDTSEYHAWGGPIALAPRPDGGLALVGQVCAGRSDPTSSPGCRLAIWRSDDGIAWRRTTLDTVLDAIQPLALAVDGGTAVVVAIRYGDADSPGVRRVVLAGPLDDRTGWTTTTWEEDQVLDDLVVLDGTLYAVAADRRPERPLDAGEGAAPLRAFRLFRSADLGATWSEVSGLPQPDATVMAIRTARITLTPDGRLALLASIETEGDPPAMNITLVGRP